MAGHIDVDLAGEIWKSALDAPWDGMDTWFHSDIAPGNLLLDDGKLAAAIDVGTCGVGDPSCDMAIAWTLLTVDGRQAFRKRLSIGEDTWERGRGWALWRTLITCAQTIGRFDEETATAHRILGEIFSDYSSGGHSG